MKRTVVCFVMVGLVMTGGSIFIPRFLPPEVGVISAGTYKDDRGAAVGLLIDRSVFCTFVLSSLCEPVPELRRTKLGQKLFPSPNGAEAGIEVDSSKPELAAAAMRMALLARWTGQIALARLDPTLAQEQAHPPYWSRPDLGASPDQDHFWTTSIEVAAGFPFRATYASFRIAPIGAASPVEQVALVGTMSQAEPTQAMLFDNPLSSSGVGFYNWNPTPIYPIWWGAIADVLCWGGAAACIRLFFIRIRSWRRFSQNRCVSCGHPRRNLDVCPECGESH